MKGDIFDMSERSRRAILKWYLIYRKNPAAIGKKTVHKSQLSTFWGSAEQKFQMSAEEIFMIRVVWAHAGYYLPTALKFGSLRVLLYWLTRAFCNP